MSSEIERLDREIERLERQRTRLLLQPQDDFADGSILHFIKTFNGSTRYTYVAVKVGLTWYVSGRDPGAFTWTRLMDLVEKDGGTVDGLWYVTEMEQVL